MTDTSPQLLPVEHAANVNDAASLIVRLNTYEGPLDALLDLARTQKVDLREVSIVELVDQYLAFMETARHHHLELVGDYLVMAAWLTYLKSVLILPKEDPPHAAVDGEAMAAWLSFQLQKLSAMRESAQQLNKRPQLGRDVWALPHLPLPTSDKPVPRVYHAEVNQLLTAYAACVNRRHRAQPLLMASLPVMSMDQALGWLKQQLPTWVEWKDLMQHIDVPADAPPISVSGAKAATLAAALELTRQQRSDLQQLALFASIYMRKRQQHIEGMVSHDA